MGGALSVSDEALDMSPWILDEASGKRFFYNMF